MLISGGREGRWCGLQRAGPVLLLVALVLLPEPSPAADTVFLQDGRAIQVEKVEELGDTVRITPFAGPPMDLPRQEILSIHRDQPPGGRPVSPGPARLYEGLTGAMVDKVRGEVRQGRPPSAVPPTPRH